MIAKRPPFVEPDGKTITRAWKERYGFAIRAPKTGKVIHFSAFGKPKPGMEDYTYVPTPKQLDFHESVVLNCIIEGSRGTGKSGCIRMDAHMRALAYPGYSYLIVRRTMPELKKSHLKFMSAEMSALGGTFHKTDNIAYYPNGSMGFFSHCETEDDMMKLLSSEYFTIYFDEISTFTWVMIAKVASCARVPEGSELLALVRGGTNPIGVGAAEVRRYYITKDVTPEEDPEYLPDDYQAIHTTLEDNPHIDRVQYIKRLSNLPEHIRRAWLDGEWVVEGAYFHDYKPRRTLPEGYVLNGRPLPAARDTPWHVAEEYPKVKNSQDEYQGVDTPFGWIQIYRAVDWGFSPDPCVCLWIAILPNSRAFVIKERTWRSTTAKEVALAIKRESQDMRIVETYCDPSMFFGSEATDHTSVGDIFENNGVPLTPSKNDRAAAGFAIHEYLNTVLADGLPQVQFYQYTCPFLVRTLGEMRVDKNDPSKIADGNDHWVIALAYFCLGRIGVSQESFESVIPRWMRKKPQDARRRLGYESVRVSSVR